ncbi:hypothetical protein HAX54_043828 [Datura stramonium]|uniref:Uncharacterized protein n=1 Tax=Datura stramonium TaxID=4076 RepID=A0ABS8W583_DATST|nr:hypothetical protein [Datura stramonium]
MVSHSLGFRDLRRYVEMEMKSKDFSAVVESHLQYCPILAMREMRFFIVLRSNPAWAPAYPNTNRNQESLQRHVLECSSGKHNSWIDQSSEVDTQKSEGNRFHLLLSSRARLFLVKLLLAAMLEILLARRLERHIAKIRSGMRLQEFATLVVLRLIHSHKS